MKKTILSPDALKSYRIWGKRGLLALVVLWLPISIWLIKGSLKSKPSESSAHQVSSTIGKSAVESTSGLPRVQPVRPSLSGINSRSNALDASDAVIPDLLMDNPVDPGLFPDVVQPRGLSGQLPPISDLSQNAHPPKVSAVQSSNSVQDRKQTVDRLCQMNDLIARSQPGKDQQKLLKTRNALSRKYHDRWTGSKLTPVVCSDFSSASGDRLK